MEKLISGFAAAVLDYWKQLKKPKRCRPVASTYSGSHESAPLNSQRFGNRSEKIGLG
jgi:hypothetical protein